MELSNKQETLIFVVTANRTGIFQTLVQNSRIWYVDSDHIAQNVNVATFHFLVRHGYLQKSASFLGAIDYYEPTAKAFEFYKQALKPTKVR